MSERKCIEKNGGDEQVKSVLLRIAAIALMTNERGENQKLITELALSLVLENTPDYTV